MKKEFTRENWIKLLSEYKASNLKISDFCRLKRVSTSRFYYWRLKLNCKESHPDRKLADRHPTLNKKISKSNFITVSEKDNLPDKTNPNDILFKISGHEISFSSLPDPAWIAKLILEVKNESASA